MNASVRLLLIWLWIMHVAYPSMGQNNTPAPEKCKNRDAIAFDSTLVPQFPNEWFVARATLRTILPKGVPEPTINSCAPLNYLETCQGGMYVENFWHMNGSITKIIKAYSAQYDDIVEYWEEHSRQDPHYFIYVGSGLSMTLKFRNGFWQMIPYFEFPEMVKHTQGLMYAITEYGITKDTGKIEWILYQACDEDFAWIEIVQWVLKENRLDEVNQIIDDNLGINLMAIPQMEKLELELPFRA